MGSNNALRFSYQSNKNGTLPLGQFMPILYLEIPSMYSICTHIWILNVDKQTIQSGYANLTEFLCCNLAEFQATWFSHYILFKLWSYSTETMIQIHDSGPIAETPNPELRTFQGDSLTQMGRMYGLLTYAKGETWPHEQGEMSIEYSQNGSYGLLNQHFG